METDEHIVIAEMLEYEFTHVGCRGALAAVVDHTCGQRSTVLMTTVDYSEYAVKAVNQHQSNHDR